MNSQWPLIISSEQRQDIDMLATHNRFAHRIPQAFGSTAGCLTRRVAKMAMREESPASCKQLLTEGYKYLDVRTPQEFSGGNVDGAKNVPFMFAGGTGMVANPEFLSQVQQAFPDKTAQLVVACQSGKRSSMAIQAMQGDGYTNLVNMQGGYGAWSAEGL